MSCLNKLKYLEIVIWYVSLYAKIKIVIIILKL